MTGFVLAVNAPLITVLKKFNHKKKRGQIMHEYYCECGGLILPDFDAYKVGDKVKFRVQKRENRYQSKIFVTQKQYTGEITKIDGDEITVKAHVRTYIFHRHEIMPLAAPSPIAYLLVGSCRCPITKGVGICAG